MNLPKILRLAVLSVCLYGWGLISFAQVLSPFNTFELLRDGNFQTTILSQPNSPSIIKQPSFGAATFSSQGNNQHLLSYVPDENFVGRDTITYSYWVLQGSISMPKHQAVVFDVKPFILSDSYFIIDLTDVDVELPVLESLISNVPVSVQHLVMVSSGTAAISSEDQIYYTPVKSGLTYIRFVACDSLGFCESANVRILVRDQGDSNDLTSDTIYRSTLKNRQLQVFLPDEGFNLIQAPEHGTLEFSSSIQSFYTPDNNFSGTDVFELLKSTEEGEHLLVYIISIINHNPVNLIVVDDKVHTSVNQPVTFNVKDNDLFTNFPINQFTQPQHGSVVHLGNGEFIYTPAAGFIGVDIFTYRVCPMGHSQNCETAVVTVFVNNLKPQLPTYRFTTAKNIPYVMRYLVPITSYEFEVIHQPINGGLEFYSGYQTIEIDGQNVSGFNMMVYYPGYDFSGDDEMRIKYCVEGDCKEIKVYIDVIDYFPDLVCFDDCVWPGDINNDGRVDMSDLLPLGYYLGKVGTARSSSDQMWLATYAENWGVTQMHGNIDMKHADGNGDGIVGASDTSAIVANYMKYHRFTTPGSNPLTNLPFYLQAKNSVVEEGELAEFDIIVGSFEHPAYDFSGLSFNLNFDGSDFVDTSTISFNFNHSNWLNFDGPYLDLTIKPNPAQLDAGLARADGRFSSGFGSIGKLEFIVVRDIDGIHPGKNYIDVPVYATNIHGMIKDGSVIQLPDATSSIRMYFNVSEERSQPKLSAYPNPASDNITIYTEGEALIQSLEIVSLTGQVINSQVYDDRRMVQVNTHHFIEGLYIIRATTDAGVLVTKMQILR